MKNGERGKKRNYINSLAQVERITGYHFFPNLADSIRSQIEDTADEDMWWLLVLALDEIEYYR